MLRSGPENRSKKILVVTDGDTSHGEDWYGEGIPLIIIGIGSEVNETTIKEFARRNHGVAELVTPYKNFPNDAD